MKTKLLKFTLPIGMGLLLFTITVSGLILTTFNSCEDVAHCTNKDYPLYCSIKGTCCPAGYAHLCDGQCYQSGCPSGTVSSSICSEE